MSEAFQSALNILVIEDDKDLAGFIRQGLQEEDCTVCVFYDGASGLRQVHELVLQLRGTAGERQVPGSPRVGYSQLYGAPGTAGVAIVSS